MNAILKYLIVFIFSAYYFPSFAFEKVISARNFSVNNGLSQSTVTAFLRDKNDLIWIGTSDGLNCFDGTSNKVFKHSLFDNNSIIGNTIRQIYETEKGNLWINTESGISFYQKKTNSFLNYDHLKGIQTVILKFTDQKIWLWIQGKGYYLFDKEHQNLVEFSCSNFDNSFQKWVSLHEVKIIKNKSYLTSSFFVEFNLAEGKEQYKIVEKSNIPIDGIFYYNDLLVFIKNSKIIIKNTSNEIIKTIDFKFDIKLAKYTKDDIFWIINIENQVFEYNIRTQKIIELKFKTFEGDIENYIISNVIIDKDNNYWITTDGKGILITNPSKINFEHFKASNLNQPIRFLKEDSLGRIWISVHLDGIYVVNKSFEVLQKLSFEHPICKSKNIVSAYKILFVGKKAFSTTDNGLLEIDFNQVNSVQYFSLFPSIPLKMIDLILESENKLLISSQYGLFKFDLISKKWEDLNCKLKVNFLKPFQNKILLGSVSGLYIYDRKNILKITLDKNDEINNINVKSIHISKSQQIFLCTEVGLLEMDAQFKNANLLTIENGLPDNFVYSVLESSQNELFGSTNKGLFAYNLNTKSIRNFDLNNGLQSLEFNSKSFLNDAEGNFYFGGIYGLNRFNPLKVKPDSVLPKIYLSNIKIFEDDFNWQTDKIFEFNHFQNTISFEGKTKEYLFPELIKYAFKLKGLENNFNEIVHRNLVRFSNLNPGKYQLFAKAANKDGVWSKEKLLFEFIIHPPFYKTIWFIIFCFLITSGILALSIRAYTHQKIKKQLEEAERQKMIYMERLRISRDMHDDIGAGISKIAIMSEVAKNHNDKKEILNKISLSSRELVDNISHIIWSLNPENDKLDNILSYIRQFTIEYFENTGIACKINFDILERNIRLSQEERRNIFLVIKESFNNILKYSHATEVDFSIKSKANTIIIEINDNGKGFDLENSQLKGNGLTNMAKRIKDIGGFFSIKTAFNMGTKIRIEIKNNMFEVFL